MDPLIRASGLTYAIRDVTIVERVDLEVRPGELVVMIGPNGAGKSTLLGMLAGDLRPSAGTIELTGMPLAAIDSLDRALVRAVLVQQTHADVPFQARDVVAMGRHPLRVAAMTTPEEDTEVVEQALGQVDMLMRAHVEYRALSGGEQRRVSVARTYAQAAPLLLLDEPAAALDVAHQEQLMTALRLVAAEGAGVLATSHDLNLAAAHAERIVILAGGRVVADGPPWVALDPMILSQVYEQRLSVVSHPTRACPLVVVD